MTSFESLDRLRHQLQAPSSPFFDGAMLPERPEAQEHVQRETLPTGAEISSGRASVMRQLTQAQRMESISRVTGGIAHNFNNLLTGIMGFCDLLAMATTKEAASHSYLEKIMASSERGRDLVKQLLTFSQQELFEPRAFDLNQMVSRCQRDLAQRAGEDIKFVVDLDAEAGSVCADPVQIERMISNLADNAVEAMPNGGHLVVRTRGLELDGSSVSHFHIPPGAYLLLEVEDTGSGIEDAIYDRIFEPFFSTKEELNGTGLGLSVVFGIVKQSDGHIRVESSAEKGTCVRIYLPHDSSVEESTPYSSPESTANTTAPSASEGETVLLAEDDPTVRLILQSYLVREGYRVLEAVDGAEALELSQRYEGRIDLLLTDIVMPRMDGLQLAKAVVAQRPELSVMFMSGFTHEQELLSELLEGNQVDFLEKPFEPEVLGLRLREMLISASQSRRQQAAA